MNNKFLSFIGSIKSVDQTLIESIGRAYMTTHESAARRLYENAYCTSTLDEGNIMEGPEQEMALNAIQAGQLDTNGDLEHDYPIFMASMQKSKHPESLTFYSKDEYADKGARLFKIKGLDAGFAIDGDGDIISVHNNSGVGGLGRPLIQLAKRMGGKKLDHFDIPKLNQTYGEEGFEEYDRYPWDDQYAPKGWDYEKMGRPSLVLRRLPQQ